MALDSLIGGPVRTSRPVVARGRVTAAPASNLSPLRVALVNYSSTADYEVPAAQWASLPGDLPIVGDTCVVVFDDQGDAWVPVWDGEPVIAPADPGTTFPGIPVFAQATQPTATPPWAWIKTNTNPPELWVEDGVAPVGQVQ